MFVMRTLNIDLVIFEKDSFLQLMQRTRVEFHPATMLSEINQTQKDKDHIISLTCGILRS